MILQAISKVRNINTDTVKKSCTEKTYQNINPQCYSVTQNLCVENTFEIASTQFEDSFISMVFYS